MQAEVVNVAEEGASAEGHYTPSPPPPAPVSAMAGGALGLDTTGGATSSTSRPLSMFDKDGNVNLAAINFDRRTSGHTVTAPEQDAAPPGTTRVWDAAQAYNS